MCFAATQSLLSDVWVRFAVAAVPMLAPMSAFEVIGNLANFHWYLLYLMPWLFLVRPRTRGRAVMWALVVAASCLTEVQCVIYAPLAGWQLVKGARSRAVAFGWVAGIAVQVVTFLSQGRPRSAGFPSAESTIKGYLINVVWGSLNGFSKPVQWAVEHTGWAFLVLMFAALLGAAAATAYLGTRQMGLVAITVVIASMATWCLSYVYNNNAMVNYDQPPLLLVRWGTGGAMLLASIIPLFAAAITGHRTRSRMISRLLIIGMIAILLLSFRHAQDRVVSSDGRNESLIAGGLVVYSSCS